MSSVQVYVCVKRQQHLRAGALESELPVLIPCLQFLFITYPSMFPLQHSCLGNPVDRSLVGCCPCRHTELDMTEVISMHWRRKWQPTLVFLPVESQGQRSLVGCHLWGHTESDTTGDLAAAAASMFVNFITLFSLGFINLKMVSVIYYIVTTIIKCQYN